jgi:hypothetical protein
MVPNYIIPSEYEMLEVLSRYEGGSDLGFKC